jgi:hypothetical protein
VAIYAFSHVNRYLTSAGYIEADSSQATKLTATYNHPALAYIKLAIILILERQAITNTGDTISFLELYHRKVEPALQLRIHHDVGRRRAHLDGGFGRALLGFSQAQ